MPSIGGMKWISEPTSISGRVPSLCLCYEDADADDDGDDGKDQPNPTPWSGKGVLVTGKEAAGGFLSALC